MRTKSLLPLFLISVMAPASMLWGENYSLSFDGVDDYVDMGDVLDIQGSFTVSALVYAEPGIYASILGNTEGGSGNGYWLYFENDQNGAGDDGIGFRINTSQGWVKVLTPAIYGGAANVGMVPTGGSANKYLDGTGAWIDVTTGDIESVNAATAANLLGINITTPLGPNPTVGLDIVGRDVLGGAPATDDSLLIYDTDTAKNKKVTVANLKLATETLYDLTTAPTGTAVRLTDAAGSDDVTISGFTGQTVMSRISASELRVALTPSVVIANDITLTNGT